MQMQMSISLSLYLHASAPSLFLFPFSLSLPLAAQSIGDCRLSIPRTGKRINARRAHPPSRHPIRPLILPNPAASVSDDRTMGQDGAAGDNPSLITGGGATIAYVRGCVHQTLGKNLKSTLCDRNTMRCDAMRYGR